MNHNSHCADSIWLQGAITVPRRLITAILEKTPEEENLSLGKLTHFLYLVDAQQRQSSYQVGNINQYEQLRQDLIEAKVIINDPNSSLGFAINYDYCQPDGLQIDEGQESLNDSIPANQTRQNSPETIINNAELLRQARKNIYRFLEDSFGRPLNLREIDDISIWLEHYHLSEEVILLILTEYFDRNIHNFAYIEKVVADIVAGGAIDLSSVQSYLARQSTGDAYALEIAEYLSLQRNLTSPEKKLIHTWFEEEKRTLQEVLNACDKTVVNRRPTLAHVDAILRGIEPDNLSHEKARKSTPTGKRKVKKSFEEYDEFQ